MSIPKKPNLEKILTDLHREIHSFNRKNIVETGKNKSFETVQSLTRNWNYLLDSLTKENKFSNIIISSQLNLLSNDKGFSKAARYLPGEEDEIKKILVAIQGYLDRVSKEIEARIEKDYPFTMAALFECAEAIVNGHFGEKIKDAFTSNLSQLNWKTIFPVFLVTIAKKDRKTLQCTIPEILPKNSFFNTLTFLKGIKNEDLEGCNQDDKKYIKEIENLYNEINLDPQSLKALVQICEKYIHNLVNPSRVLIKLLLKINAPQKAIHSLTLIKNEIDRGKATEEIIDFLTNENKFDEAIIVHTTLGKKDQVRSITKLVERMIDAKEIEKALIFVNGFEDIEEKEKTLRQIALKLTQNNNFKKAIEIINLISDFEIKSHTQSNMAMMLARQQKYTQAKEVASMIEDPAFKEDAIEDIVKSYLHLRKFDEAIKFVESLANSREKVKPAKIIESSLKAYHQDEKVKSVRKIFSLMSTPLRPAA